MKRRPIASSTSSGSTISSSASRDGAGDELEAFELDPEGEIAYFAKRHCGNLSKNNFLPVSEQLARL